MYILERGDSDGQRKRERGGSDGQRERDRERFIKPIKV